MGVTINRLDAERPEEGALVADRRLFVDAGGTQLLEEGDPNAAFLLAAPGRPIAKAAVDRLGLELVEGLVQQRPVGKQAAPPENKMVGLGEAEDKAVGAALDALDALDALAAADPVAGAAPEPVVQSSAEGETASVPSAEDPPPPASE